MVLCVAVDTTAARPLRRVLSFGDASSAPQTMTGWLGTPRDRRVGLQVVGQAGVSHGRPHHSH